MTFLKRYGLLLVVILTLFFILYYYSKEKYSVENSSLTEKLIVSVTAPIQKRLTSLVHNVQEISDKYLLMLDIYEENKIIKKNLQEANLKLAFLEDIKIENNRLRKLIGFIKRISYPMQPARVIGNAISQARQAIRIDRGSLHGLSTGMPVVSPDGVVGQIYLVTENYSDALLISNASSDVSGIIQRNRVRGVIEGSPDNLLRLKYVHQSEDVKLGDLVVTSNFGGGGIFPQGLSIGKVIKLQGSEDGITQIIFIKPSVDFSKLEEVFVIKLKSKIYSLISDK